MHRFLKKFTWTPELVELLDECKGVYVPTSKQELYESVFGTGRSGKYDVVYDVAGRGEVCEATVVRKERRSRQLPRGLHAPSRSRLHAHR